MCHSGPHPLGFAQGKLHKAEESVYVRSGQTLQGIFLWKNEGPAELLANL